MRTGSSTSAPEACSAYGEACKQSPVKTLTPKRSSERRAATCMKPHRRKMVKGTPDCCRKSSVQALMRMRGTASCRSQLWMLKNRYRWMPMAWLQIRRDLAERCHGSDVAPKCRHIYIEAALLSLVVDMSKGTIHVPSACFMVWLIELSRGKGHGLSAWPLSAVVSPETSAAADLRQPVLSEVYSLYCKCWRDTIWVAMRT